MFQPVLAQLDPTLHVAPNQNLHTCLVSHLTVVYCCRHADNKFLDLANISSTAVLLKNHDSTQYAWMTGLGKAVAAAEDLLQQLQSRCHGAKLSRPAARNQADASSKESVELCQLGQAVVSAITTLRKSLQGHNSVIGAIVLLGESQTAIKQVTRPHCCVCI